MSDTQALIKQDVSPLTLIQQTLSSGGNAAELAVIIKELVALQQSQERFAWEREERQAKIDFDDALNRCQKQIGRIAPNQSRNDTRSWWADYAQLDRAIRPIYTAEGFSVSYSEVAPLSPNKVRIRATVARAGITREYFAEITPSTKGPKGGEMATATDADAIAQSRAKRYLMLDIFNIAVGIDREEKKGIPTDDFGTLPESEFADWLAAIEGSGDKDELFRNFKAAEKAASDAKDKKALTAFNRAKNEVWRRKGFKA